MQKLFKVLGFWSSELRKGSIFWQLREAKLIFWQLREAKVTLGQLKRSMWNKTQCFHQHLVCHWMGSLLPLGIFTNSTEMNLKINIFSSFIFVLKDNDIYLSLISKCFTWFLLLFIPLLFLSSHRLYQKNSFLKCSDNCHSRFVSA